MQDRNATTNQPTNKQAEDTELDKEKMNNKSTKNVATVARKAAKPGKDKQLSHTNLEPMDKTTSKESTHTNERLQEQPTKDNTNKEINKGQGNKNNQVQGRSKEQSTPRIQEYTISTSNLDAMEEDSLQAMYYDWHWIHDRWMNDVMK